MSPRIFSCVLCGYVICDYENLGPVSWLKQFRILYSSKEGIAVTGVGLYDDPEAGEWIAPSNFEARWDDIAPTLEIGVISQNQINGRYGFPFHEACWSLLEKAYSSEPIPYKGFFEVCKSLPVPSEGTGLSWGHDFKGLVLVNNHNYYPWEDRFVNRDSNSVSHLARNNPYDVPEIQQLLFKNPQAPPVISSSMPVVTATDCFAIFPEEIRIMIVSNLPTVDALKTRLASRLFVSIFYSQIFWASRFRANADRSWIFELQEWNKAYNWRWLYRCTNKAHCPRGIRNRERVWKLIQHVQGILCLQSAESFILFSSSLPGLRWVEATGDLRPEQSTGPYHNFNEGCRLFHEQQTFLPTLISQIAFSVVQLGDTQYISGIRLIPCQGEAIQLGYRMEKKELFLNIASLTGFNLAVGSRGIQGIQCIVDNSQTQWFGCPDKAPRTTRLAVSRPIVAIKAGFDGCKIVSLAIAEHVLQDKNATEESKSLRDSAFWYPQIPRLGLSLNEHYFAARDSSMTRYQPLCWTLFGGPQGIYLRHLTGMSVTCRGTPCGIEFYYNTNVPIKYRKLGRYKSSEYAQVIHFSIDGPAGEVINAIDIYLEYFDSEKVPWFYKNGALESFKISTNRGRSCDFRQQNSTAVNIVEVPIMVAPRTTINGFYWSQHENSITSLGVVSEVVRKKEKDQDEDEEKNEEKNEDVEKDEVEVEVEDDDEDGGGCGDGYEMGDE